MFMVMSPDQHAVQNCYRHFVHGTVHLSNTSHLNTNEMQLFLFSLFGVRTLHVSDALCVHHQEHYKL